LFLARAASAPRMLKFAGWLTPATACVLLAILSLNSENVVSTGGLPALSLPAMMSNQSYAVYATSRQSAQNNLSVFTFDWTNRNGLGSTMRFAPFSKPTD